MSPLGRNFTINPLIMVREKAALKLFSSMPGLLFDDD